MKKVLGTDYKALSTTLYTQWQVSHWAQVAQVLLKLSAGTVAAVFKVLMTMNNKSQLIRSLSTCMSIVNIKIAPTSILLCILKLTYLEANLQQVQVTGNSGVKCHNSLSIYLLHFSTSQLKYMFLSVPSPLMKSTTGHAPFWGRLLHNYILYPFPELTIQFHFPNTTSHKSAIWVSFQLPGSNLSTRKWIPRLTPLPLLCWEVTWVVACKHHISSCNSLCILCWVSISSASFFPCSVLLVFEG